MSHSTTKPLPRSCANDGTSDAILPSVDSAWYALSAIGASSAKSPNTNADENTGRRGTYSVARRPLRRRRLHLLAFASLSSTLSSTLSSSGLAAEGFFPPRAFGEGVAVTGVFAAARRLVAGAIAASARDLRG